jgi:hypothetical protein
MQTYPQPNNNLDAENHNHSLPPHHTLTKPITTLALVLLGVGIGVAGDYVFEHNSTVASNSSVVATTPVNNQNSQLPSQSPGMIGKNSNYITSIVLVQTIHRKCCNLLQ